MVSHDHNPSMEHQSSHSSHGEDEALRVPPEQVDKLATKFDKMHNWILKENHNTNTIADFYALKKVISNDEHGVIILHGLTHLVHTHVKPLTQATFEQGMALPVSTLEPTLPIFVPISNISTYVSPIVNTYV